MADILDSLPQSAFKKTRGDKFAPSLDFNQRCAILALVRRNVSRPIIAAAFSVDRRTVGHIANEASLHYRDVRKRFKEMGMDDFCAEYLRADIVEMVAKAAQTKEATAKNADYKEERGGVSVRSNKMAGVHTVKPLQCSYSHRIEIQFIDDPVDGGGWYYRDIDSSMPDAWLHNGEDSRKTSKACYDAAFENLVDDLGKMPKPD